MKRRTIVSAAALVLICAIALSLCSCLYSIHTDYSVEAYEKGLRYSSVMPRPDQFGDSEEVFTKHFQVDYAFFRSHTYILIAKYDREKYEEKRDLLLSSGGFETEPIKEPDYGDIATSFELDGFHFGYLLLSEYPKRMYFIGYRDETRQIAYVWFDDPDKDYITEQFDQFLRENGWECPE